MKDKIDREEFSRKWKGLIDEYGLDPLKEALKKELEKDREYIKQVMIEAALNGKGRMPR